MGGGFTLAHLIKMIYLSWSVNMEMFLGRRICRKLIYVRETASSKVTLTRKLYRARLEKICQITSSS
ncbi:hypothetical protein E2320_015814 [Naja naja]|nr:hypothetical protein E2320_015814 [Naja naja]